MKYCHREVETTSRVEMKKFDGTNFELKKLKMENFLVDLDIWDIIFEIKPNSMKDKERKVLEKKVRSLIRICLVNSLLLNFLEENPSRIS